jgi:ATPase subunit of ABC transporter with duplicated ATPase domains
MARIVNFTVDGMAGRSEPFSAHLPKDVNVFFGLNGSGKTTLLKLLYSAVSNNTTILKDLPFKKAAVTIFSHRLKGNLFDQLNKVRLAG